MFKLSFSIVLTLCLLRTSLANPQVDSSPTSKPSENKVSSGIDKLLHRIEDWLKNALPKASSEIETFVKHVRNIVYTVEYFTYGSAVGLLGRFTLVIASGAAQQPDRTLENIGLYLTPDQRIQVIAMANMWTKLEILRKVDRILVDKSEEAAMTMVDTDIFNEDVVGPEFLSRIISRVDFDFRADAELNNQYEKSKNQAAQTLKSRKIHVLKLSIVKGVEVYSDYTPDNHVYLIAYLLNKQVINDGFKNFKMILRNDIFNQYIYSNALVQFAESRPDRRDKLNDLYLTALYDSADEYKFGVDFLYSHFSELESAVFNSVKRKLREDYDLESELDVVIKEISRNASRFDLGMLRVNLSLL